MNKKDLKTIIDTREHFIKFKEGNRSATTVSGFCRKDGSFGKNSNTACHAGLGSYGKVGDMAVYSRHMNKVEKNKNIDMFYHYLLYESPWAKVFIKPDVEDVVEDAKDKGLMLDANAPRNMLVQACFASRMASENKERLYAFPELYDLFNNKDLAFITSYFIVKSGRGYVFTTGKSGHTHFPQDLSKKYIENFLRHKSREDEPYTKRPVYSQVNQSFDDNCGPHMFLNFLNRFEPKEQIKTNYNIFDTKPQHAPSKYKSFTKKDLPALVNYVEKEFL